MFARVHGEEIAKMRKKMLQNIAKKAKNNMLCFPCNSVFTYVGVFRATSFMKIEMGHFGGWKTLDRTGGSTFESANPVVIGYLISSRLLKLLVSLLSLFELEGV